MRSRISTRRGGVLMAALLVVGLLASFGWGLQAPTFITHEGSILRLPLLSWWRNIPLIFSRDFLMFSEGQFRPLSYALLAVVRTFVEAENVVFWHIWLLVFHGLNAALVFLLVRRFSRHLWSAILAAFVFGLHPLASVVVNNIDHFHYILGLTFYLGALWCYVGFADTRRKGLYAGTVGLFVLGLFTSKVVFTLPIVLGVYEVLYRRRWGRASPSPPLPLSPSGYQREGFRPLLRRLLPFVAILVMLSPLWWLYKPHPLYYKYPDFPAGAGWYSFFSVVGATGWYLKGLLLGRDIPVVLHEVLDRIFRFTHWRFLVWGGVDLGILVAAGWALRRGWWAGLGVMLMVAAMVPFASTNWNGVEAYVSWVYLYVPVAGLAMWVGGLADGICSSLRGGVRAGGMVALGLVVLWYGMQQARLNIVSRSGVGYWGHVLQLNPDSEIASVERGKAHLRGGEAEEALGLLFSPVVKQIQASSLAMSRHYTAQGDVLAAAIHLGMTGQQETGLQFQSYEMVAADVLHTAGALDYAQEVLGRSLMANPYNVAAMEGLAEIWVLKGYVAAAERLGRRALEIAPFSPETRRMGLMIERSRGASADSMVARVVHPPQPNWLRYAVQGVRDPRLREEIVRASEHHRSDPVIQMEAGFCLVKDAQPDRALSKLDVVTQSLSSYPHAWAMKCWAAVEAGAYAAAEAAGQRALELDPRSPTVQTVLGFLDRTLSGERRGRGLALQRRLDRAIGHYQQALQLNPNNAVAHNNLGNLLARQGSLDEAIAHYRRALRIKSDFAKAHNNLGIALARQGKAEESVFHFQQALRIEPDFAEAHNNLGLVLVQQGKPEEAIEHYRQALRIRPDYANARDNLSKVLVDQGR